MKFFKIINNKIIEFEDSNGIKRIEVPTCREEPCALIKGQPLKVKITYESSKS